MVSFHDVPEEAAGKKEEQAWSPDAGHLWIRFLNHARGNQEIEKAVGMITRLFTGGRSIQNDDQRENSMSS